MRRATVRSLFAKSWSLRRHMIAVLAIAIAGCGNESSSSPPPTPPPASTAEGLWVPNFATSTVVELSDHARAQSGEPSPTLTNSSASLALPEGVTFDTAKNLWVTNCSDPVTGAGSITEFSRQQLRQLASIPAPGPAVTLSDDGLNDIFECPYGADFDTSGNLWTVNRFLANLIEFTPAQLEAGGIQPPKTQITSTVFDSPLGSSFDAAGAIWIVDFAQNQVYGFSSTSLAAASGTIALLDPDITNSSASLDGPSAIAFDGKGNQWVSNCLGPTLTEFAPQAASGSPTPLVILQSTTVTTPSGSAPSLSCPEGLAFDRKGNLWVSNALSDNAGSVVEFTSAQLAASGSPAPAVFLDSKSDGSNISQPSLLSFGVAIGS
jgi:secreted PhoX family phosphatase